MRKQQPDIPHGMWKVYRRFERWRDKHPGVRLPIPKSLWTKAAEAARENGVGCTAQVLGLEYGKLKRLAESAAMAAKVAAIPSTFVELVGSQAGLSECLVELEGPHGKMRIQWKGTTAPDLTGLSRGLWESA